MKQPPVSKKSMVPLIALEIILGSMLASLAFLAYADLSQRVLLKELHVFDQQFTTAIFALRSPLMNEIMLFLSFLGGNFLVLPGVLVFWYLLKKRYRHEAILFTLAVLTGIVVNLMLKTVVARTRPDMAPLIDEIFYSFPSGHSMNAFIFYSFLAYLNFHFTRRIALAGIISVFYGLLILLIGVSRVYLGVHYPSDVVAGYLAGLGWLLTILVIDRTLTLFLKPKH
jgi:membrane-associated phospholipid phosphatase